MEQTVTIIERVCPSCRSDGRVLSCHVDPASSFYGLDAVSVPLRRCVRCRMQFFDLLKDVNERGEIYSRNKLSTDTRKRRHDVFVRIIAHEKRASCGLEIGAGSCHVGVELARLGHTVTAVDKYPEHSGAHDGIVLVDGDCTSLDERVFPKKSFDWILADNILEHLPTYGALLANLSAWLKDDGFILVSVPNGNTVKRFVSKKGRLSVHCPIEHVNIFTPKTLDHLFRSYGMERRNSTFRVRSLIDLVIKASIAGLTPLGIYRCYRKV